MRTKGAERGLGMVFDWVARKGLTRVLSKGFCWEPEMVEKKGFAMVLYSVNWWGLWKEELKGAKMEYDSVPSRAFQRVFGRGPKMD